MKPIQWISLLFVAGSSFLSFSSHASGFHCNAECAVTDQIFNRFFFLGEVSQAADLPQEEVFRWTLDQCAARAKYYNGPAKLLLLYHNDPVPLPMTANDCKEDTTIPEGALPFYSGDTPFLP